MPTTMHNSRRENVSASLDIWRSELRSSHFQPFPPERIQRSIHLLCKDHGPSCFPSAAQPPHVSLLLECLWAVVKSSQGSSRSPDNKLFALFWFAVCTEAGKAHTVPRTHLWMLSPPSICSHSWRPSPVYILISHTGGDPSFGIKAHVYTHALTSFFITLWPFPLLYILLLEKLPPCHHGTRPACQFMITMELWLSPFPGHPSQCEGTKQLSNHVLFQIFLDQKS